MEQSEVDKNLSTILEVEPEIIDKVETEIVPYEEHLPVQVQPNQDVEYDYELSRETHRQLIEQGQEALTDLLKVAKESQHPRAYEVASGLLKNLSDMTDKLMILQEKMRELDKKRGVSDTPSVNVEKAVFVGSTSDLLKQIKEQ
jgi:uncharacterized protein YihD (DUF1040 family)